MMPRTAEIQGEDPAQAEVGVELDIVEDDVAGDQAQGDGQTGGDVGGQVQLLGGVVAHLADGGGAQTQQAAQQAAAGQDNREDAGGGEGGLADFGAVVQSDGNHDGGSHGGDEALEQVGAVAGDVVDVVADEVGDGVGHAAVILGHVVAQLGQNVSGDVSSLGVVAAGHAVEHGDHGAAQRVGGNSHDGGVALQVGKQTMAGSLGVDAPDNQHDDQTQHTEGLDAQTADAAAAEGDLDGLADGQRLAGLVGGADVGVSGASHAQNADDAAHGCAEDEGDAAGLLNEEGEDHGQNRDDDGDGAELGADKGRGAVTDDAGHFGHIRRTFLHLLNLAVVKEDVGDGKYDHA